MSNRIVFNIYTEDLISGHRTLEDTVLLTTELTASEAVEYLEVYEGFQAYVVEGIVLSFVDFSCLNISADSILAKLNALPRTNEEPQIRLPGKCILKFESECNDELLVRDQHELVYTYDRFECGASGFGETVIRWVTEHPIEMIFIGGWLWDRVKDVCSFLRNRIYKFFNKATAEAKDIPIIFSAKKFHKKLAKLINIDPFYFQIISISPVTQGKHTIHVRTIKNDEYEVVATANGAIISIEKQ